MERKHYNIAASGHMYTVYFEDGWYFVELFKKFEPILCYDNINDVVRILYKEGRIKSRNEAEKIKKDLTLFCVL